MIYLFSDGGVEGDGVVRQRFTAPNGLFSITLYGGGAVVASGGPGWCRRGAGSATRNR